MQNLLQFFGGTIMTTIFSCPGKYVQGSGAMHEIGQYAEKYGQKALVILADAVISDLSETIRQSFETSGASFAAETFGGECCNSEIERLSVKAQQQGCDMIIGIGGGKTLDTAKAVAYRLHSPVLICPTIASTDAPCSALSVIYSDSGVFSEYLFLPANPNLILVDSAIIARSPQRLTVSGMGDALATYFEARACYNAGAKNCVGGAVSSAAMALASQCYDNLMQEGIKAKLALDAGVESKAVAQIIETNTLLSGIGFESGGLAGAHAIHNGFTVLEECHHMYHGEKVAFGTLVQLMLENAPTEELNEVYAFCCALDLPTTLADLGAENVSDEQLAQVADAACSDTDTMGNMPFHVTPHDVFSAIKAADAYGRYFCKSDIL